MIHQFSDQHCTNQKSGMGLRISMFLIYALSRCDMVLDKATVDYQSVTLSRLDVSRSGVHDEDDVYVHKRMKACRKL